MAEGIRHEKRILEDLERDITCAVCQERYTEPKLLPCLHYYCKKCILQLAHRTVSQKPFSCPECHKETTLPVEGVDGLKTAFFVYRMQSMYSTVERVHGKVEVKCEGCTDSEDKAEAFCRQCAVFICKECVKQHKKWKAFSSHEVDTLEDLKQGRVREITVEEPPTKKCPTHEEPLIIYCFDCATLICHHCTAKIHRDHNFEFSKVAAPNTRKTLLNKMNPVKDRVSNLSQAVKAVQATIQEVEEQGTLVSNTILTSFAELAEILEKRKNELLQENSQAVQKKVAKLVAQEKNLSLATAELHSIVDYTERFVGKCSDNEVMSMLTEIDNRIQVDTEEHSKSGLRLEPVEEANMGVEVIGNKTLQGICQTKAKYIYSSVDPGTCTVEGEGVKIAEVGKTAEVLLTARLSNNKTARCKTAVVGILKSLYDKSVIECNIEQLKPGEYSIRYQPVVRGRHELIVSVDKQQVLGSPFSVFVSISPALLGHPVKVWRDIGVPHSVSINSKNQLLVATGSSIIKLDGDQKIMLVTSTTKMAEFRMASTDIEDNIYCTSAGSSTILRCDKEGGNVQLHEVTQGKNPGYWGIAVVGNEVMVCEHKHKGSITVCNKDLRVVRRISFPSAGEFYGISGDVHGNVYVTDAANSCIRVYSNDKKYLRHINCRSKKATKLTKIRGIYVSGDYVYVTDWDHHCVAVFTTAGEFVTSFGQEGDKDGHFDYPADVCVDRDGFVYVADDSNRRIQCF